MNDAKKSEVRELLAGAGAIALLTLALLAMSGCATNWSKGEGSMFRVELEIGNAPISGQGGADHWKKAGPGEDVARHELTEPTYPIRPLGRKYD